MLLQVSKDIFVKVVQDIRTMLASGADAKCSCSKTECEWHGDCYNHVRIHRHFGDHVSNCLQFILKDKVKDLARAAEMTAESKPRAPDEH